MYPSVTKVTALEDFRLLIALDNGSRIPEHLGGRTCTSTRLRGMRSSILIQNSFMTGAKSSAGSTKSFAEALADYQR